MYEPIVGEKQCTKCLECKPVTAFPWSRQTRGNLRLHSHCCDCKNSGRRHTREVKKREAQRRRRPPSPMLLWRGPVNRGQLVPAIGVR